MRQHSQFYFFQLFWLWLLSQFFKCWTAFHSTQLLEYSDPPNSLLWQWRGLEEYQTHPSLGFMETGAVTPTHECSLCYPWPCFCRLCLLCFPSSMVLCNSFLPAHSHLHLPSPCPWHWNIQKWSHDLSFCLLSLLWM